MMVLGRQACGLFDPIPSSDRFALIPMILWLRLRIWEHRSRGA
jgi:hypothetical protein